LHAEKYYATFLYSLYGLSFFALNGLTGLNGYGMLFAEHFVLFVLKDQIVLLVLLQKNTFMMSTLES